MYCYNIKPSTKITQYTNEINMRDIRRLRLDFFLRGKGMARWDLTTPNENYFKVYILDNESLAFLCHTLSLITPRENLDVLIQCCYHSFFYKFGMIYS